MTIELQRSMVANTPCQTVSSIDASHSAYFSRPQELAKVIQSIAAMPVLAHI